MFRYLPLALSLIFGGCHISLADDGREHEELQLSDQFQQQVLPILTNACLACHDSVHREAELDLEQYRALSDIRRAPGVWEIVLERLQAGEMPPQESEKQLTDEDRQTLLDWIASVRRVEAERTSGDPGPVLARRLSNAEYDYSVLELTGRDLHPTRTFPVDPANSAGFDNSGESLSMSPALLNKYLAAARSVSEHLVFTPNGLEFASHPVVTDTDRDKYCVKRIVDFYQRQPTDLADYFYAARLIRQAEPATVSIADIAAKQQVSENYLATIHSLLEDQQPVLGPLAKLRAMWQALPEAKDVRRACEAMRDYVLAARQKFEPHFDNLDVRRIHKGSQPFVLWKNKQYASQRRSAHFDFLASPTTNKPAEEKSDTESSSADSSSTDSLFDIPVESELGQFKVDCQRFCQVFPDAFFISERGRDYLDIPKAEQEKGRLLSAGFHSMMGYFRDDQPLMELILDEAGRETLDGLWRELDFFAAAPQRQYQGFLWFERTDSGFMRDAEFDFARPEDKAALTTSYIERLADGYVSKARKSGADEVPLAAIRSYFTEIDQQIRWVELARMRAEGAHVDALVAFASRANRRPLRVSQELSLRRFYQQLRNDDGLSHEEAVQDVLVSILMSPEFLYRVDLLSDSEQPRPLDDYELASRLSYFLWSGPPDEELLRCATEGDLSNPQILVEQTRRMLGDARIQRLATEFAGNWLDIRRFEEHNAVDREHFQEFNDSLRAAMFEEPLRFFTDLVANDRPLTDCLTSQRTFVNPVLAKHYGMQEAVFADRNGGELAHPDRELGVHQSDEQNVHEDTDDVVHEWREVANAGEYGRGGLLPMAVFLTKNAPGLRTSPVKRGYWVVRNLLGERIPPPPPNVPELPSDESQMGELTLRETLAKHREHESCAGCHNRIDSIGLVFENYGPIGELRQLDLGGRTVDTHAEFPDGSTGEGVEALKTYIAAERMPDFLRNVQRKLLTYALGRSLQLSDTALLEKLWAVSTGNEHRMGPIVEAIVTSPQFLNKRGRDQANDESVK